MQIANNSARFAGHYSLFVPTRAGSQKLPATMTQTAALGIGGFLSDVRMQPGCQTRDARTVIMSLEHPWGREFLVDDTFDAAFERHMRGALALQQTTAKGLGRLTAGRQGTPLKLERFDGPPVDPVVLTVLDAAKPNVQKMMKKAANHEQLLAKMHTLLERAHNVARQVMHSAAG